MSDLNGQTFVLVHGAWHGGWCWRDVAIALRARGAEVFTPTMTGLGEKKHLRSAYKGLDTFITDVTSVIETEELTGITLVGHSFGGMVITGVADRLPGRIKRLVYLDAITPADGQSIISSTPDTDPMTVAATSAVLAAWTMDGEWMACPSAEMIGIDSAAAEIREWSARQVTEHPLSSFTEALPLKHGRPNIPSTYIVCDNPPMPGTAFVAHHANVVAGKYGPQWTARRIDTGHMCMMTALDETVGLLAEAALSAA